MRGSRVVLAVVGVLAVAEIALLAWLGQLIGVWWTLLILDVGNLQRIHKFATPHEPIQIHKQQQGQHQTNRRNVGNAARRVVSQPLGTRLNPGHPDPATKLEIL